MIKNIIILIFLTLLFSFSVAAYTVTNEDDVLNINGSGTVEGRVTFDASDESSNITVDVIGRLECYDDGQGDAFDVAVDFDAIDIEAGDTETAPYSFEVPEDVAGTIDCQMTFTADGDIENMDVRLEVTQLRLKDLDVRIEDVTDNNIQDEDDGYRIDIESVPGDDVRFTMKLENLFTGDNQDREGDINIESISVEITIEDINESDDVEINGDVDDIDPGDSNSLTLQFTIPTKAESDEYKVMINVDAEDENGHKFDFDKELALVVERNTHELMIEDAHLTKQSLGCNNSTDMKLTLINIGDTDEDEVRVLLVNSALGINIDKNGIELVADPAYNDNEIELTFNLEVDADAIPGDYWIQVISFYNTKVESNSKSIKFTKERCSNVVVEPEENVKEPEPQTEKDITKVEELTVPEVVEEPIESEPVEEIVPQEVHKTGTRFIIMLAFISLAAAILIGLILKKLFS